MKKLLILLAISLLLLGCADTVVLTQKMPSDPYGFWSGLWHGWIILWSWIGSLFSDDIAIYAINNNGGWYDFGFALGVGVFGGSSTTYKKRKN